MYTIKDVHLKIKEISRIHFNGAPHIHIDTLKKELNIPLRDIAFFLDILHSIGFINYFRGCKDVFSLTETGKSQDIP